MQTPLEKTSFLIVDDFGDMRSMLRSMLSLFGVMKVDHASNGKDAIQQLENHRYDVVLCDYNLGPGKDGQQVLEEARHRKLINHSTVFVIITAENKQDMVLGAIEYQPDGYLSKPFTKDLLRSRIEKLLIKKQDLQEVDAALEQNDYGNAIAILNQRIASKPRNLAELTRLKAELCVKTGAYDEASSIYEQVLALRELPWARLGLGKVQYRQGEYTKAQDTFQGLVKDNPRMTEAYDWLSKTCRALGDQQQAQEVLEAAAAMSPKAILRQQALGDLAMENRDYACARQAYQHALLMGKHSVYKNPRLYFKLIESQLSNETSRTADNCPELIRQLEREFGNDPEGRVYSTLSTALVQEHGQQVDAANQSLNRAAQLYRQLGARADTRLSLQMGRSLAQAGIREEAQALFQQLVRDNHDDTELLKALENAYRETGLSDNPKLLIEQLQSQVVTLNNQGVELATSGKIDEAVNLFAAAAEGMSHNKTINLNAARALIMQMEQQGPDRDSLNKARLYLERTRKIAPGDVGLAQVTHIYQRLANSA